MPNLEIVPPAATSDPLVSLGRELDLLANAHRSLRASWPKAGHVLDRAAIGGDVETAERRIAEIRKAIASTPARSLAGAAVQLRELEAMIAAIQPGPRSPIADLSPVFRLLSSARTAIEKAI